MLVIIAKSDFDHQYLRYCIQLSEKVSWPVLEIYRKNNLLTFINLYLVRGQKNIQFDVKSMFRRT